MNTPPESTVANLLAELRHLATRKGGSIHDHVLQVAARGLGASGGAVWSTGDNGALRLASQVGLGAERIDTREQQWSGHADLLRAVQDSARPQIVNATLEASSAGNGSDRTVPQPLKVLAGPVYGADSRPNGVIELFLPADSITESEEDSLTILDQFCRGVATISDTIVSETDTLASGEFSQFTKLCRNIHSNLDVETTAVAIANEARAWIGCDRVSVFETRGRRCRLLAVSDQDNVDQRSRVVRSLQSLAETILKQGQPLFDDGRTSSTAEAGDQRGNVRSADALERRMAGLPMPSADPDNRRVTGVLIAEDFRETGDWDTESRMRLQIVASQGGVALENALDHRSLPLSWLGRGLLRLGWRSPLRALPRWIMAIGVCVAIGAGLALYPADFVITGGGELQPETQRDVFARTPGIIDEVHVAHNTPVELNQPLISLRSPEFEQERVRLEGRLRTTQQQIDDLASLRKGAARDFDSAPGNSNELAARELELISVRDGVQNQLAALAQAESELTLSSPLTGRVLTWDPEGILEGRPVEPQQRLLTVADVDGPWTLKIRVHDRDIRHVIAARDQPDELRVSFVTATDVETLHWGVVASVAQAVEYDPLEGPVVVVTAEVERDDGLDPRPGATVYPHIQCGQRPIGYIWFRRLIDSTKTWLAL